MGLYSNGTNNNIDFNWWGINDANSQVSGNGYLLNNWYVLKITINDSTADVNTTYNVTGKKNVNVTHFFELNDETQNDKNLLPLFKITYIDDKNKSYTFGVHDVFKYSTIGNAETFLVRSLLDKEDLAMRLSFSPVTDVKTTITSNNTNPNVKDIIKIIINNSNLSPVDAENITTSIVIPDGFEYISNNNTNATYDPSTKTITWKIDKLNANANKLLEIILKAVIKGNYTINVETKTDTYDSNLSNNKAELNIKVKPESNNVSPNNNTTPNKNNNLTANAKTTNTKNTKIPLKDTGVPLIGILIVLTTIAMIFKRKN